MKSKIPIRTASNETLNQPSASTTVAPPSPSKKTFSGNFHSKTRSKSAESGGRGGTQRQHDKKSIKYLLQLKDDQIERLVEKVGSLIEYNGQFAKENARLVRDRKTLRTRIGELERSMANLGQQLERENAELRRTNEDLAGDVKMLKTLVYRLNVQIERYQEVLRQQGGANRVDWPTTTEHEAREDESRWRTAQTVLAPLLNAYEEVIREKTQLAAGMEAELNSFTGKLKDTLAENERLHKEVDKMTKSAEVWSLERGRMQAQIDLFRNKAQIQGKQIDTTRDKIAEIIRIYEQKVQSQSLDIERLQEAYSRSKGELLTLRNIHQKPEAVVESLQECQRLFQQLKMHHDTEKLKLEDDLGVLRVKFEEERKGMDKLKDDLKESQILVNSLQDENRLLKQALHRLRRSRELYRSRLKKQKTLDVGKEKLKTTWDSVQTVEALLQQRQSEIRTIHLGYQREIDSLRRKLAQREETLRNVLQEKSERAK